MDANSPPILIPLSYETLPVTHIKLSHHPPNSPTATPILIVTLNRPEKHNAYTQAMGESLERVFQTVDIDDRVKVVVLTGAGRTFCAGADLDIGFSGAKEIDPEVYRDSGGRIALAIHRCRKPTIAAMQGSAVGVGMTMTLPAAIRIAHTTSKYGFVFARRGITMESCSSYFLPRLIGHARAMYLVTTGGVFPPTSSHFGPLFAETFAEKEAILARGLEIAGDIAENTSSLAGALNRGLMWRGPDSPEETHLLESGVLYHMFRGRDQKEGVSAFLEKRKPEFKATLEEDAPREYPWWSGVDIDPKTKGESKL